MFETPQECILDTLEPLQPSKKQICSKFEFFEVSHTPEKAILGSFWAKKIQNACRKWPRGSQKIKKISIFLKHVPNSLRIHFGLLRTTTAFKKPNLLKIWVFQGFPYTRFGHFEPILGLKISKSLQKMAQK